MTTMGRSSKNLTDRIPTPGTHLLIELHGCGSAVLDDADRLLRLLFEASSEAGARVVAHSVHRFQPGGVTLFCALAESHISLHTWPEEGYAAADFYTCGRCRPEAALARLVAGVSAARWDCIRVRRGLRRTPSLVARRYYRDSPETTRARGG